MATLQENIQNLMMKVPGYKGYAEKENRRAADKELRDAIAAAYASQVTRITRLQERLINRGDFATTEVLDKVITKLQHLADRIRTASYGYTPLFDRTDRLDETDLDRLYAFDLAMANGIDNIGGLINDLSERTDLERSVEELLDKVDELHRTFDQRAHLINTFPTAGATSSGSAGGETARRRDDLPTIPGTTE
jgi:hypothetical protein